MTFFRHFPSKEGVVLGLPPDSAGIVVAEHVLTGTNKSLQPSEIARIVLDAVVEELATDGLSDIALRLSIVHENPTLLKALYARIPQWIRVVDALLANSLRTAHDDAFSMHLKASAMVMYWVETLCEWSRRGGAKADRALLQTVAGETDAAIATVTKSYK